MGVNAVLRPVGPRPARVYWWRRLFILVLLVALGVGIARALSGGGGGAPTASDVPTPTLTPTSPPSSPGATPVCRRRDLAVVASTDAATYPVGVLPHLSAVVRNVSGQPCRFVTAPGRRSWTIASGPDRVWASNDCTVSGVVGRTRLRAGHTVVYALVWNRHRSANGCPVTTPEAAPGTYRLTVSVNGVAASPVVFHLTN